VGDCVVLVMSDLLSFGNPADLEGPVALRPRLAAGLPFFADLLTMTSGHRSVYPGMPIGRPYWARTWG